MRPCRPAVVGAVLTLLSAGSDEVSATTLQAGEAACVRPLLLDPAEPLPVPRASVPSDGESAPATAGGAPASDALVRLGRDGGLCRTLQPDTRHQGLASEPPPPGRAFLYSALLPGMGQRYLGQGRWIAYLGIEAWAWVQFFDERAEGNSLQSEYRDLAWSVARRVSSGVRIDGDFEYYEALTKFTESGAWDADPLRPGIQPEMDPETFNGSVWELAREIFFPGDAEGEVPEDSEAYRNAVAYYQERGVPPNFAWSWRENELTQAVYGDLIQQSDENLRNSTTMAGVILANHVVSAVDALISARLRIQDPDAVAIQVVPFPDRRSDWGVEVRLAF